MTYMSIALTHNPHQFRGWYINMANVLFKIPVLIRINIMKKFSRPLFFIYFELYSSLTNIYSCAL